MLIATRMIPDTRYKELTRVFKALDIDGDGQLNMIEFKLIGMVVDQTAQGKEEFEESLIRER